MFCNQCGSQMPDGSQFCAGCGADLSAVSANPEATRKGRLDEARTRKHVVELKSGAHLWELSPGDVLQNGRYRVERQLGRGGMGIVFLVRDKERGDMPFAIKVLPEDLARHPQAEDDVRREVHHASGLRHDGIVAVYDVVREQGTLLIKMEFVDGPSLAQLLREQGQAPWQQAVAWATQACEALQYAHDRRLIHQDLKPGNLLYSQTEGRVKVADFGLAVTLDHSLSHLSLKGQTSGTVLYMPPEQFRGQRTSYRSDIYSLGATLYELLAGRPPFQGRSLAHQILNEMPPRIPGVPGWLNDLVMQALAKGEEERPPSMAALAEGLAQQGSGDFALEVAPPEAETRPKEAAHSEPVVQMTAEESTPVQPPSSVKAPSHRRRMAWVFGLLTGVLVLVGGVFILDEAGVLDDIEEWIRKNTRSSSSPGPTDRPQTLTPEEEAAAQLVGMWEPTKWDDHIAYLEISPGQIIFFPHKEESLGADYEVVDASGDRWELRLTIPKEGTVPAFVEMQGPDQMYLSFEVDRDLVQNSFTRRSRSDP